MSFPSEFLPDQTQNGKLVGKPREGVCGLYEATAKQYYPIGTEVELYGRKWVYCRAHEAITLPHRGSPNLVQYPWIANSPYSLKGLETDSRHVTAAGLKKMTIEADDYQQDNSGLAMVKNGYTGGHAVIFFDSDLIATIRITGSDICIADPDSAANLDMVIYFDDPLPTALVAASHIDVYPSPYIAQGNSNSGTAYSSFTVVPMIAVPAYYFFWGQVKGPAWVTPNAGITASKVRDVAFHTNGTILAYVADYQRAGYIIHKGDGSADDALIMLDL